MEPLLAALQDTEHVDERKARVQALGLIGDGRAILPLLTVLSRDFTVLREAVETALVRIGTPSVEPLILVLTYALEHPDRPKVPADTHMLYTAAVALGQIGDARAVEPLVAIVNGQLSYKRLPQLQEMGQVAKTALVRIGKPAVPSVIEALKSHSQSYLPTIDFENILGEIADPRAAEPLIETFKECYQGLLQWQPEERQVILGRTGAGRAWVRIGIAAAEALGKLGDQRAVEPLAAMLGDSKLTEVIQNIRRTEWDDNMRYDLERGVYNAQGPGPTRGCEIDNLWKKWRTVTRGDSREPS